MEQSKSDSQSKSAKRELLTKLLTAAIIILMVLTAVVPGALRLLYRADSQVALGNAKLLKTTLMAVSKEAYGADRKFGDLTGEGGLSEKLYREVLVLSKVPGDFQVLQTDESGYEVQSFLYKEGDIAVYYRSDPGDYEVYHLETYIDTGEE